MKIAKRSCFSHNKSDYVCAENWPEDCFCQCGDNGTVFVRDGENYNTAFFEAFPMNTFIRGEGGLIEEAEKSCWTKYQKYLACPEHEFEQRDYWNGAGFCKNCGLFRSKIFEWDCVKCGKKTNFHHIEEDDTFLCRACFMQDERGAKRIAELADMLDTSIEEAREIISKND